MIARRPRIAYLTYGSGEYDARTLRMARTAIAAGYDVTIYARWYRGLPVTEDGDGFRIVRAPHDWRLAVPGLRDTARRRAAAAMREGPAAPQEVPGPAGAGATAILPATDAALSEVPGPVAGNMARPRRTSWRRTLLGRLLRRVLRRPAASRRRWWRMLRFFPLYGLGWAAALDEVAEPADIWHGMWAGSLPALDRMRSRFGGLTIYDSRDVYMQSRALADATGPGKSFLEWLERRWAQRADAVVTVNDAYADLLVGQLGVPRPVVLMNLPERWSPPVPRPDLIRAAVGIEPGTAVVIYQGGLMTGRGIEEAMDAILDVPDAVLVLLGFGQLRSTLVSAASKPPYAGKVFILDPVPPADLVSWTASADVSVMAIQPTSLNHRFTTPQKLFESIAAGIPVVASDLPGMAAIVESTGSGLVCDPTSPSAIAAAIRTLLAEPTERREQRRAHILQVAHERYNWEAEEPELLSLYRRLLEGAGLPVPDVAGRAA